MPTLILYVVVAGLLSRFWLKVALAKSDAAMMADLRHAAVATVIALFIGGLFVLGARLNGVKLPFSD